MFASAGQRGDGEEDGAGEEGAASAEDVGAAAAEQQEAGEDDRVGVDDPLEAGRREAEAVADRRQRDVDDRDVEDDHELRQAEQDQQGRRAPSVLAARVHRLRIERT